MRKILNWMKKAVKFPSDVTVAGKLVASKDFDCLGDGYCDKDFNVSGRVIVTDIFETESSAHFMGAVTLDSTLEVDGASTLSGDVTCETIFTAEDECYFNSSVSMSNLPTSDPAVGGQLWNDGGTLKISAI